MAEALAVRYMQVRAKRAEQEEPEPAIRPSVSVTGNVFTQPTAIVDQGRLRDREEERYRAEGRINIDAPIVENLTGNWFLPGDGNQAYFKDLDVGPEMVVVPGGEFIMGSPSGEPGHDDDEEPQRTVNFPAPFAVSRYAITFDQWDAAVSDGGCRRYRPDDQGWGRGDRPVINVSWDDAQAYAAWLSANSGQTYHLLTEAQLEYTARAGTVTPFWSGTSITPAPANYDGNLAYQGGGTEGEYRERTVPVDSFEPNPWGLYQVYGNVWEWTDDCWNDSYEDAPQDGSAWRTGNCSRRVLRGGSWIDGPQNLRFAMRILETSDDRDDGNGGFRVARTLLSSLSTPVFVKSASCAVADVKDRHVCAILVDSVED